jgi:hypothetical protein
MGHRSRAGAHIRALNLETMQPFSELVLKYRQPLFATAVLWQLEDSIIKLQGLYGM